MQAAVIGISGLRYLPLAAQAAPKLIIKPDPFSSDMADSISPQKGPIDPFGGLIKSVLVEQGEHFGFGGSGISP